MHSSVEVLWLQNKPKSSHFHRHAWQLVWGLCFDMLRLVFTKCGAVDSGCGYGFAKHLCFTKGHCSRSSHTRSSQGTLYYYIVRYWPHNNIDVTPTIRRSLWANNLKSFTHDCYVAKYSKQGNSDIEKYKIIKVEKSRDRKQLKGLVDLYPAIFKKV